MSTKPRECAQSEIEHVRKFVAYAKLRVNAARYYPPNSAPRYLLALALYSKSITVAEATMALIHAGFSDEAFGMTRTLIDIFFTLHYITNKDTEERAQRYAEFTSKNAEVWSEVIKTYWPQQLVRPLDARTKKIASTFHSPHQWSGKTAKELALEPDTVEVDPATGKPATHDFAYRVIYRWTSHYVHPTINALGNHLVQAGRDNFVVRSGRKDMSHMALFNIASYLSMTMVCFYRCMRHPQPERVSTWSGALAKHLARRHK
jgi:Family of unknown function (DUF5677)